MSAIVPQLIIKEADGSPSGQFSTLKVSNTTLTDNGDGTATLSTAGGAAGIAGASGTYTGDGTTNRAIAHGLGVTPKFVAIGDKTTAATSSGFAGFLYGADNTKLLSQEGGGTVLTVTAMDSTNFYVSSNMNTNTSAYNWFACG